MMRGEAWHTDTPYYYLLNLWWISFYIMTFTFDPMTFNVHRLSRDQTTHTSPAL